MMSSQANDGTGFTMQSDVAKCGIRSTQQSDSVSESRQAGAIR